MRGPFLCRSFTVALIAFAITSTALATNGTWSNLTTGGNWSTPNNWTTLQVATGIDGLADFSTLSITADNTVHLDSARTIGGLKVGDTTPSNNWIIDNNTIVTNVLTLSTSTGSPLITVDNQSAALTMAVAGTQGFIKSGAGTLVLGGSGANTFSGAVTVKEGTLSLAKTGGAIATSGILAIGDDSGAPLSAAVISSSNTNFAAGGLNLTMLSDGLMTFAAAGVVPLNSLTMTGGKIAAPAAANNGFTLVNDLITLPSNSTAIFTSCTPQLTSTVSPTHTFNIAAGATPSGIDLDVQASLAEISGSNNIIKAGLGTLRLGAANTFSGGINLTSGTISVGDNAALGTGTLTFSGGSLQADGAARTLSNAIALTTSAIIGGNFDITLAGLLNGAGGIIKNGSGTLTLSGASTLTAPVTINSGNLAQSGTKLNDVINQSTFTYNSGAFSGRLTNVGTATFNADFTAGNGMENYTGLSLPPGRVITLNGLGLDNQGSLTLTGGTLNLSTSPNAANINRGTLNLSVVAPLKLNAAMLQNNGTLNLNGGTVTGTTGLLTNGPGGLLGGSGAILSPFTNAGGVVAISTGTLSISQPFNNSGLIQLASFTANLVGGTITNSGVISGIGAVGNNIANTGTIEAIGSLTLAGTVTNNSSGRILAPSGSKILFTGAGGANSGNINLQGGSVESTQPFTNNSTGAISGIGSLIVGGAGLTNNGSIAISGNSDLFGKLNNNTGVGTKGVTISGNATATFWDAVTNTAGSLFEVASGSTATFAGPYSGAGLTGSGQVNFAADVGPGFGPAKITFGGNVSLAPTAKLQIEVAGTAPGSQFDQMQIANQLTLAGTLQLTLTGGFAPALGNSFDILDWSTLSGTFTAIQLPALSGGLSWNTSQLYTTGVLQVIAGLSGDFNHDNIVNAADYITWRKGLGTTYTQNDYTAWRANFGRSTASASTLTTSVIPEPTTLALLLAALSLAATRSGARCTRSRAQFNRVPSVSENR